MSKKSVSIGKIVLLSVLMICLSSNIAFSKNVIPVFTIVSKISNIPDPAGETWLKNLWESPTDYGIYSWEQKSYAKFGGKKISSYSENGTVMNVEFFKYYSIKSSEAIKASIIRDHDWIDPVVYQNLKVSIWKKTADDSDGWGRENPWIKEGRVTISRTNYLLDCGKKNYTIIVDTQESDARTGKVLAQKKINHEVDAIYQNGEWSDVCGQK